MLKVGLKLILYCDTDSIVSLQDRKDEWVIPSRGLGDWADEMDGDNVIGKVLAVAPKSYMLVTKQKPTGSIKAKKVSMTVSN